MALVYALGFVLFVSLLPRTPQSVPKADGVVVLTGGGARLDRADELFESGVGERLLISGVDPTTSKETLKHLSMAGRVSIAAPIWAMPREDTHGNAVETADWARTHDFHRLILVTARYHMPRSLREFSAAMPGVTLLPYPVEQENVELGDWWRHPGTVQLLQREYMKYLASFVATGMARA